MVKRDKNKGKRIRIASIALLVGLSLITSSAQTIIAPNTADALGCSEADREARADFYSKNDIQFIDPCDAGCSTGGGSIGGSAPTSLSGEDNYEKVWNYFTGRGLSPVVTAGMMGNLEKESHGMNPWGLEGASYHGGQGFGIVQWTGGRRPGVEAALAAAGITPADYNDANRDKGLLVQLNYLWDEMEASYGGWEQFSSETTVGEMSYLEGLKSTAPKRQFGNVEEMKGKGSLLHIHARFVISGDQVVPDPGHGSIIERMQYGLDFYEKFSGNSGGSCGANAEGLAGLVSGYVLPDYHSAPYAGADKAKPEYVKAQDTAVAAGRYVGSPTYYADCGGFVTTLIIDSGFDPTYNHNSKISEGAGPTGTQRDWLRANWQNLGNAGSIDAASLQPGDVWISDGHTFVFIGDVPGINSKIASASLDERVPMAGGESITDSSGEWFRKKG